MSAKTAVICAVAAAALQLSAAFLVVAAGGFDLSSEWTGDVTKLLHSGAAGAAMIRWGGRADMLGYLSLAPVVLFLRERYAGTTLADLYAVAGLAFVVIGAIGAVILASAAPDLIERYGAVSGAGRQVFAGTLSTVYREVVVGMWNTLELIPAAVWGLGMASVVWRHDGPRVVAGALLALGLLSAGISLARLLLP